MSAPSPDLVARAGTRHRYADAVVVEGIDDVIALCVRSDEDDPRRGDAVLLRLRPGRSDVVASVPWPARAVSVLGDGRFLVVDLADSVHVVDADRGGPPVLLRSGVRAVRGEIVLAHDGQVLQARSVGDEVVLSVVGQVAGGCVLGASSADRVVVGTVGGSVVELDHHGHEYWRAAPGDASAEGAAVDAAAIVDGVVVIAAGHCLQIGPRRLRLPHRAAAVARCGQRWFVSSVVSGLMVVDDLTDDGHGDVVRVLRPSLRAHHLIGTDAGLVAVGDLFVATSSDGYDFFSRDLSAFVRLANR